MLRLKDKVEIRTRNRYYHMAVTLCRGKPPDDESSSSIFKPLTMFIDNQIKKEINKGGIIMKTASNRFFRKGALASFALLSALTTLAPERAQAVMSSANATIHNPVTVRFTSGTKELFSTAVVNVTVATLATQPTVTTPAGLSVYPGDSVNYTAANSSAFTIRSNSNGPDTYTFTSLNDAIVTASVTASSSDTITGSVTLWGGYIMGFGGANQIKIPAGSETGLTANALTGSTIEIGSLRYRVTTIAVTGSARTTTAGTGTASAPSTTAETYTTLTLAPIGHLIDATTAAIGTQAGEYKSFEVTFTAGSPTTPGADGKYDTTFTITTTAKVADNTNPAVWDFSSVPTTAVRTIVYSPSLTITKKSRNVTTDVPAGAGNYATNVSARPGDVLEYEIVVANAHPSADATKVSISDALPADYVTAKAGVYTGTTDVTVKTVYNAAAQTTAYYTFAGGTDTDQAYLNGSTLYVTLGNGAGDANSAAANGGTLKKDPDNAKVYFQVTVK